ncbi:nuclear factor interleukin-3-regulated protein-like [Melanotaenia boesemani]|uniref:nuclear factor interleukin-3-regulated protein-like n=1 Tax=Melanotaenia boesemani TaxID=1250792 RepID=UPI001C05A922|nr:nuclear factor interleukin-3-regulated protein-like [Melanotaenia boesemani]
MAGQTMGAIIHPVPSLLGLESRDLGGAGFFADEAVSILHSTSRLAKTLLGHTFALKSKERLVVAEVMAAGRCDKDKCSNAHRKREFICSEKKDEGYWDKRRKNNEAAKRSREKRRANDIVLESQALGLLEENACLRAELLALKFCFGLVDHSSDVAILPLTAPLCGHLHKIHSYQAHTVGPSLLNTQPSTSIYQVQPLELGITCRPMTAEPFLKHSTSAEPGVSTLSSSKMESPVFFDDTLDKCGRPSLRGDQQDCNSQVSCVEINERQQQESLESLKSLPHKLRFKIHGGSSSGREMPPSPYTRYCGPPVAMVGPNIQMKNPQQMGWDGQTES